MRRNAGRESSDKVSLCRVYCAGAVSALVNPLTITQKVVWLKSASSVTVAAMSTANTRHPSTQRIYDALSDAGSVPPGKGALSSLARLLNMSPDLVKDWDSSGPSDVGLLMLQDMAGLNASWVRHGYGVRFIASAHPEAVGLLSSDVIEELHAQPLEIRVWVDRIIRALIAGPLEEVVRLRRAELAETPTSGG